MRHKLKVMLLVALIGVFSAIPVSASELQWENVTFKMAVPEGVEISAPVYVMYTGQDTDLFAELSAENNYTAEVNAVQGKYDIYQIVPTFGTDLTFMGTSSFMVAGDNPTINIYIKDAEGLINADITEGEVPNDLATYGELISAQVEAEQSAEQQKLKEQQEEAANATYTGEGTLSTQPGAQGSADTADAVGRQTKISEVTATDDAKTGLTGLMIIGAVILGVGMLVIICVLVRKYKNIGEDKDGNSRNNHQQGGNYLSNR